MMEPPREFRTARLRVRQPVAEDAPAIFREYATDSEVTRYLTWAPHRSHETVTEFLHGAIRRNHSHEAFSWVLSKLEENTAIGMLEARIRGHMANIGYVLGRKYWGNGYMPEAVSEVTAWMLKQPELFRVWAVCDIENLASARTLEKSGFEREGTLRRWIIHPNVSPEPRDCYVYARTR